ncbi:pilus assembly protein [Planctomonas sp. JC2975]|uniref:TadE/TadG family type IV pilus assembly protein n=1 Tax=Planctomonas sp. JC2975 TaxID=2729626 RepID=UPI001475ABBE|nr:TadE/TadG family type IV pilus assembly protein [Planctomonas sp. JC2975]NNC11115.1 pilus assembly protein [Planctomonas sp. JC2975]
MTGWHDERGSAPAEFAMVAALLTVLTLAVLQLGLALLVRNTLIDAAAEGAHVAALADNTLADGRERTRSLIGTAVGDGYASDVTAAYGSYLGVPAVIVTVRAPLPLAGLFGPDRVVEVSGHAPVEVVP